MNTLILYAMGLASLAVIIAGGVILGDHDCVLHPSGMVKNFCLRKEHNGIFAEQAGF